MSRVAHILGGWSPNIGNAFFQLAGYEVLREVMPRAEFVLINEKPGYPQYWNPRGGNPTGYFDMASAVSADYIVLMGPMFRSGIMDIWGESLDRILAKGTKLVLLGVAAMKYTPELVQEYRRMLKRFRPHILVSRDSEFYKIGAEYADFAFDGIDFAFFLPDYFPVRGMADAPPYIALSFDKRPEPTISVNSGEVQDPRRGSDIRFEFEGSSWRLQDDWRARWVARSRAAMMLESLVFPGSQVRRLGHFDVVRTDHRYAPILKRRTFRYPNVMVNDTPFPYLDIYGNARLTISDRIHAGVIALAYGRPAMVLSQSPRFRLLERVGVSGIGEQPMMVDQLALSRDKERIRAFLRNKLNV